MNYTENYHLPQWEETDRIMRTDFNQMCADMEAGLSANANAAAAAKSRADEGVTNAAAAQTAADAAQTTADTALTKANAAYSPTQKPYVVGSYVGTGEKIVVEIGFYPSFIIISGQTTSTTSGAEEAHVAVGVGVATSLVTFQSKGFTVYPAASHYPRLTISGRTYRYIAFR